MRSAKEKHEIKQTGLSERKGALKQQSPSWIYQHFRGKELERLILPCRSCGESKQPASAGEGSLEKAAWWLSHFSPQWLQAAPGEAGEGGTK